jgi:hypothetical protein
VNGDETVEGDETELGFPKLHLDSVDSMATNLGADTVAELSYQYLLFSDPKHHIDVVEQIQMNWLLD